MAINVVLDVFKGPLDLLLHLIEKNKIDIYDIPIVLITEQYLQYIEKMNELNMDIASEFLVMAATLLNIKAKMLLPVEQDDEDEEDPREELVRRLLEYKKYKYASLKLEKLQNNIGMPLYRTQTIPEELEQDDVCIDVKDILNEISLEHLYALFLKLINQQKDRVDPIRSTFDSVEKEEYTLQEKINYLITSLEKLKQLSFKQVLTTQKNKSETITVFLALLELIKMNKVIISQEGVFKDIEIKLKEGK